MSFFEIFELVYKLIDLCISMKNLRSIAVLIATIIIYFYGEYQYQQGVSDTKQAQYITQLEQFKQQTLELDRASKQLLTITQRLDVQANEWKFNYEEVIKKEPLPADCVISSSRLLNINAAIEQATTARKSSTAMSADRETK